MTQNANISFSIFFNFLKKTCYLCVFSVFCIFDLKMTASTFVEDVVLRKMARTGRKMDI